MIQQTSKIQSLERDKGPEFLPPNCQIPPVESADVQKVRAKHCKRVEEFSVKDMLGYMRKQSSENNQCAKAKPGLSENMKKGRKNYLEIVQPRGQILIQRVKKIWEP